jgi:putative hydrolase of the HAD superfamily
MSFRPTELRHVVDIGEKIQTTVPDLREGALETLSRISEHHTISLLTRGDENLQNMKVKKHNLDEYFCDVEVVTEKREEDFKSLAKKHGFPLKSTWSVGDSPKWDVNLALKAGLNAVLVEYSHSEYEWSHEGRGNGISNNAYYVESISEVPDIINTVAR